MGMLWRLLVGLVLMLSLLLAGPLWMLASEEVATGRHWASTCVVRPSSCPAWSAWAWRPSSRGRTAANPRRHVGRPMFPMGNPFSRRPANVP